MDFVNYVWFILNDNTLRVIQEFDDVKLQGNDILYRMNRDCSSSGDIHLFIQYGEPSQIKHYVVDGMHQLYELVQEHMHLDPRIIIHGCNLVSIYNSNTIYNYHE